MSSNNSNDNSGLAIGIAFIGGFAIIFAAILFALLAFVSLIFTAMAIVAWNKPLVIGKFRLEPEEARRFVYRGLAGMIFLPAFVMFCAVVFNVYIVDQAWGYLLIAGYAAGSLGIEILTAQDQPAQAQDAGNMIILPPQPSEEKPRSQRPLPRQPQEPFRYASWDDEEENRK